MGLLKLGFLANFLSHPVIAGFITASGILIATSQIKHILGVSAGGDTLPDMVVSLAENLSATNWITLVIGIGATGFLFWVRKGMKPMLLPPRPRPALGGYGDKGRSGPLPSWRRRRWSGASGWMQWG